MIVATWQAGRQTGLGATEAEVRAALTDLDPLWEELFPAEQARIVQLLVERVDVTTKDIKVHLRTEGLASIVQNLCPRTIQVGEAA